MKPVNLLIYGILASLLVMFFVWFNTEVGLQFTLKAIEKFSKGALKFEGAKGTLGNKIQFKKVIYTEPQQTAQIETVSFKWSPIALLEWHLQIGDFKAARLLITQKPLKTSRKILKKPVDSSLVSLPQLPIYLVVKNFDLGEIQIRSQGKKTFQSKGIKGNMAFTRTQLKARLQARLMAPLPMNGRWELTGNKNQYEFQLNLSGEGFNWKLVGQGDQTHIVFNTLQDDFLKGKLGLSGWIKAAVPTVNVQPSSTLSPKPLNAQEPAKKEENLLHWKFTLTASNLQLDKILPALLNGTLTGEGREKEGRLAAVLTKSRYYDQPLDGQAMLRFDYPMIKSFNAEFFSGKNTLTVNGNVDADWSVRWKANIENLKLWFPGVEGRIVSEGGISGKREFPRVQANLFMNELKTESLTLKSLRAETLFNMEALTNSQVVLEAQKIKSGIFEVSNLTFIGNIKQITDGVLLKLKLQPGTLRYPVESKIQTEVFDGGTWETYFTSDKILAKLNLNLMGKSHFQGQFILPNRIKRGSNQKIQGNLKGQINDLSFLSEFTSPTVRNIQGQLTTDLKIQGTMAKPEIKSLTTLKASAFLPVPNLRLTDIHLIAKGGKQTVQYEGEARSENTVLKLTGKTIFEPKTVFSEFNLFSPDFLITNTREIEIHAAPKIKITSRDGKTFISGSVQIPRAAIKPLDFSSIVRMPEDVEYIRNGDVAAPSQTQFPVESDLLVTMGENVYLKYQGLDGYLTGEVRIKSRPFQPTTGLGRIKFKEGAFQIKGRKLTIHQGYFNFNGGPLANPGIQIKATRKIQVNNVGGLDPNIDFGINEVLVGVDITGNVRRHKVKLFSEPSGLSQSNILAYLITGQSMNAGASAYFPLIMEAADSLGGGVNSSFSEKIKKGFGLSEVAIRQPQAGFGANNMQKDSQLNSNKRTKDTPTLVLGKFLSPVFYVNYTVNLIQPLSGFQAQYQLTKHWLLRASGIPGDKSSSIDLIRIFESKN